MTKPLIRWAPKEGETRTARGGRFGMTRVTETYVRGRWWRTHTEPCQACSSKGATRSRSGGKKMCRKCGGTGGVERPGPPPRRGH